MSDPNKSDDPIPSEPADGDGDDNGGGSGDIALNVVPTPKVQSAGSGSGGAAPLLTSGGGSSDDPHSEDIEVLVPASTAGGAAVSGASNKPTASAAKSSPTGSAAAAAAGLGTRPSPTNHPTQTPHERGSIASLRTPRGSPPKFGFNTSGAAVSPHLQPVSAVAAAASATVGLSGASAGVSTEHSPGSGAAAYTPKSGLPLHPPPGSGRRASGSAGGSGSGSVSIFSRAGGSGGDNKAGGRGLLGSSGLAPTSSSSPSPPAVAPISETAVASPAGSASPAASFQPLSINSRTPVPLSAVNTAFRGTLTSPLHSGGTGGKDGDTVTSEYTHELVYNEEEDGPLVDAPHGNANAVATHGATSTNFMTDVEYDLDQQRHNYFSLSFEGRTVLQSDVMKASEVYQLSSEEAIKKFKTVTAAAESLDYWLGMYNDLWRRAQWSVSREDTTKIETARWGMAFLLGLVVGLVGLSIRTGTHYLNTSKFALVQKLIDSSSLGAGFGVLLTLNLVLATISVLTVLVYNPTAGGSGLPEIKGFLNGASQPSIFSLNSLVAKIIGTVSSVSSGMWIGADPMIHVRYNTASVLLELFV